LRRFGLLLRVLLQRRFIRKANQSENRGRGQGVRGLCCLSIRMTRTVESVRQNFCECVVPNCLGLRIGLDVRRAWKGNDSRDRNEN